MEIHPGHKDPRTSSDWKDVQSKVTHLWICWHSVQNIHSTLCYFLLFTIFFCDVQSTSWGSQSHRSWHVGKGNKKLTCPKTSSELHRYYKVSFLKKYPTVASTPQWFFSSRLPPVHSVHTGTPRFLCRGIWLHLKWRQTWAVPHGGTWNGR